MLLHPMAEGQDRARHGGGNFGFNMSLGRNTEPQRSLGMRNAGKAAKAEGPYEEDLLI